MSHRTTNSSVFPQNPQTYTRRPRQRMKQDFTAIQVGDPTRYDLPPTPPESSPRVQRSPVQRAPQHTVIERSDPRIDDLVARQDQLMSHQMQVSARQDEIANHLKNQNNSLNAALMQQVLRNKDNMIANLSHLQQAEWDDQTRELFGQHIRYIVGIAQRLNSDIEGIMAELRGRDIAVMGTNKAVNKLEVHHVTMLQDLRGRILRCDVAINKHSKDIVMVMDEIRRLEGLIQLMKEKLLADIHRLETEAISMTNELERQHTEQRSDLNRLRSETNHRFDMLDNKHRVLMAELKDTMDGSRDGINHHMERMEAKFKAMIDKATGGWGDMMGQIDQQIQNHLMTILSRLNKLEDRQALDKQALQDIQHNVESQVIATLQESLQYNDAELAKAKREFRTGFTELQESMSNMKRVVEGRRQLLGNQMNKEIGQVKKALYMEMPGHQPLGTTVIFKNKEQSDGW